MSNRYPLQSGRSKGVDFNELKDRNRPDAASHVTEDLSPSPEALPHAVPRLSVADNERVALNAVGKARVSPHHPEPSI